jgi:acyl-CoA thioester hydrolase
VNDSGREWRQPARVAWIDTDASGRIHYSAVFRWVEAAEAGLRRQLGILDDWEWYPRRALEVGYRSALVFEDEIEVVLAARALGRTSITWGWQITRAGEVCVEGSHTVVHVDRAGRPVPLPDRVRAALGPA